MKQLATRVAPSVKNGLCNTVKGGSQRLSTFLQWWANKWKTAIEENATLGSFFQSCTVLPWPKIQCIMVIMLDHEFCKEKGRYQKGQEMLFGLIFGLLSTFEALSYLNFPPKSS